MWVIGVFKSSFQLREMLLVQGETDKIRLDRIKFENFCIIYFDLLDDCISISKFRFREKFFSKYKFNLIRFVVPYNHPGKFVCLNFVWVLTGYIRWRSLVYQEPYEIEFIFTKNFYPNLNF